MSRRAWLASIVLIGLLVALLAAAWAGPGPFERWRQWRAPAPVLPNLDQSGAILQANAAARAVYPAILSRPLFNTSRRPEEAAPDAPAAPPPPEPNPLDQVKVTGILSGPTLAGIMLEEGGKPRFLRLGEAIGDWTLLRLHDRSAVFRRGAKEQVVDLKAAGEGAATTQDAGNPAVVRPQPGAAQSPAPVRRQPAASRTVAPPPSSAAPSSRPAASR